VGQLAESTGAGGVVHGRGLCVFFSTRVSGALAHQRLAAGVGGTDKMISEATFQSLPSFLQLMIIRNGLSVPSCPAYADGKLVDQKLLGRASLTSQQSDGDATGA
jgi:hypothetical protein